MHKFDKMTLRNSNNFTFLSRSRPPGRHKLFGSRTWKTEEVIGMSVYNIPLDAKLCHLSIT